MLDTVLARCDLPLHLRIHLKIQPDKQKVVLAINVDRSEKLLKGCAAGFSSKIHSLKTGIKFA
jgi:hypothetical protein